MAPPIPHSRPAPAAPSAAAAEAAPAATLLVRTRGDRRSLEFGDGMVQSEMRLSRPDALVLRYVRAMMCFTLFQPRPRDILMVGLGGGSLAKFCHRHLPGARITVLELRADVIALRAQFHIPPDDARLRIVQADAADYITRLRGSVDVLLVDGFDAGGLPPALGSADFYRACRRALRADGVLVANMFSYDPHYGAMLGRLRRVFDGRLCWFDGIAGNNRILFAVKAGPANAANAASPARLPPSRPLRVLRRVRRWQRVGPGFLNRLLADWVVARLSRRP